MESQHIKSDPEIMSGTPCFAGTRVPIKNLFDYSQGQSSLTEFLIDFPTVSREAAVAVLESAKVSVLAHASAS